jgi:hypothetical protein
MHTTLRWTLFCALFGAAPLAAVACSDTTPNPDVAPQPTATAAPTAEATAAPTADPTAAPTAAPTAEATGTAAASATPPDKPKASGRPPVLLQDPKSITDTFGFSPGAKLELGEKEIATLRIPEGSLSQATNVTFALDTKCKTTGIVTGKVYKITPTLPPVSTPASVPSNNAAPFVMLMPGVKKKDLNLAIGTFAKDAKGNEALQWKVLAPAKTDEATGMFEFHLDALPDGCLHLTNKPPTAP